MHYTIDAMALYISGVYNDRQAAYRLNWSLTHFILNETIKLLRLAGVFIARLMSVGMRPWRLRELAAAYCQLPK